MISVVQNFICTQKERLKVIEREVPKMSKIFKDYDFYINYATIENVFEVGRIYEDNVKKLTFENNLKENWGEVTLEIVEKVKTPYTLILCEDFEYRITYNGWKEMMDANQVKIYGSIQQQSHLVLHYQLMRFIRLIY